MVMKYLHEEGIETSTSTAARKFSIEGLRSVDPGWLLVLWSLQVTRKPADNEVRNSQNIIFNLMPLSARQFDI